MGVEICVALLMNWVYQTHLRENVKLHSCLNYILSQVKPVSYGICHGIYVVVHNERFYSAFKETFLFLPVSNLRTGKNTTLSLRRRVHFNIEFNGTPSESK